MRIGEPMFDHGSKLTRQKLPPLQNGAWRFAREEDGAVTVLAIIFFIMLLMVAGLGIDISRQEMKRAEVQSTLDRAVLAAAGAPQDTTDEEAEAIVRDYFAKAGLSDYLKSVNAGPQGGEGLGEGIADAVLGSVDEVLGTETSGGVGGLINSSRVYADVEKTVSTSFLKLAGIDTMTIRGAAQAEYATPRMEVSLVLDVSGSMRDKMEELQEAARDFVSTILTGAEQGDAYVNIVPFSFNVTPGPLMYEALTVNKTHDYSSCLKFEESDYNSPTIDPNRAYDQMLYTAVYGDEWDGLESAWRSCYTEDYATILPYETSVTKLHEKIDSLIAEGNTSANIGMKWGAAMLDPAFQPVITSLQTDLAVDGAITNMPEDYNNGKSLKIIVLMADGDNTTTYKFGDSSPYAQNTGSDVYYIEYEPTIQVFQYAYRKNSKWWKVGTRRGDEEEVGIELETIDGEPMPDHWDVSYDESKCYGWNRFWWTCMYKGEASGEILSSHFIRDGGDVYDVTNERWMTMGEFNQFKKRNLIITDEELTWPEAWGLMSPEYYGEVTGDWSAFNEYLSNHNESGSYKDDTMQTLCTATKNQGVIIYTIGYGITPGGHAEGELQSCATSLQHYFPVSEFDISSAFGAIASNVQNLRLTQ
jgi:Flp pilus assembly protein TadG